jgi:hypothetical protein
MNEYEVEVQYVSGSGRLACERTRQVGTEAKWAGWIARQMFEEQHSETVHAVKVYRID